MLLFTSCIQVVVCIRQQFWMIKQILKMHPDSAGIHMGISFSIWFALGGLRYMCHYFCYVFSVPFKMVSICLQVQNDKQFRKSCTEPTSTDFLIYQGTLNQLTRHRLEFPKSLKQKISAIPKSIWLSLGQLPTIQLKMGCLYSLQLSHYS